MLVTTTPQKISDGDKGLLISIIDDAQSSKEYIQFAFGSTEPTEWHKFYQVTNETLSVGVGLGAMWVKVPTGTLHIIVTTGV